MHLKVISSVHFVENIRRSVPHYLRAACISLELFLSEMQ